MGVTGKKRVAESFEHKRMKQYMFENLHANNNIKRMELEYSVECRRADLYGELIDGKKFAIEFQNSKISVAEIVERTKLYNSNGIFVLWILNGVSYKRKPQNEDGKNISIEEDKLHRMYKGRVYYMNMTKQGLESFKLDDIEKVEKILQVQLLAKKLTPEQIVELKTIELDLIDILETRKQGLLEILEKRKKKIVIEKSPKKVRLTLGLKKMNQRFQERVMDL